MRSQFTLLFFASICFALTQAAITSNPADASVSHKVLDKRDGVAVGAHGGDGSGHSAGDSGGTTTSGGAHDGNQKNSAIQSYGLTKNWPIKVASLVASFTAQHPIHFLPLLVLAHRAEAQPSLNVSTSPTQFPDKKGGHGVHGDGDSESSSSRGSGGAFSGSNRALNNSIALQAIFIGLTISILNHRMPARLTIFLVGISCLSYTLAQADPACPCATPIMTSEGPLGPDLGAPCPCPTPIYTPEGPETLGCYHATSPTALPGSLAAGGCPLDTGNFPRDQSNVDSADNKGSSHSRGAAATSSAKRRQDLAKLWPLTTTVMTTNIFFPLTSMQRFMVLVGTLSLKYTFAEPVLIARNPENAEIAEDDPNLWDKRSAINIPSSSSGETQKRDAGIYDFEIDDSDNDHHRRDKGAGTYNYDIEGWNRASNHPPRDALVEQPRTTTLTTIQTVIKATHATLLTVTRGSMVKRAAESEHLGSENSWYQSTSGTGVPYSTPNTAYQSSSASYPISKNPYTASALPSGAASF